MTSPFDILKKHQLPNPKTLIQVGASGGQELEDFINAGVTDAIFIEPLDMPFSVLKHRVQNIPSYVPFQALVTATNGKKFNFHIASNGGQSSSILEPSGHLDKYPFVNFPDTIELTGYRLDTLIAHLRNEKILKFEKIDMLYVDVQGAELFVFKGAGELLENINYIWTEVCPGDAYKGGARYQDIIDFLELYQFQMVYFECPLGMMGDALFIKKSSL
jgi:FkbM family methyltransferase